MERASSVSHPPDTSQENPFLLLTHDKASSGNKMRLLNHLQKEYTVNKEYSSKDLQVYTVTPQTNDD